MYQLRRSWLKKAILTLLVGVLVAMEVLVAPKTATATPLVIQDLGFVTSLPKYLGEPFQTYGSTNYQASYGSPALGIIDPIGYIGFTPPLVRAHDQVLFQGKIAQDFQNDAYVNDPPGNFQKYTSNIYFPSDSRAVSFGVSTLFKSSVTQKASIQIASFETLPDYVDSPQSGANGGTKATDLLNSSIQGNSVSFPKTRSFLIAPQSGRLTKVTVSSNFPFRLRRLSVQRVSAISNGMSEYGHPLWAFARSTYVAMGDSFASGEGAGNDSDGPRELNYLRGTANSLGDNGDISTAETPFGCHRNVNGWVYQAFSSLIKNHKIRSSKDNPLGLGFVACSGARTIDFLMPSHNGYEYQPPQFTALSSDTKVVTVAIGINDLGFSGLIGDCVHLSATLVTKKLEGIGDCKSRISQDFDADLSFLSKTNWQADNSNCPLHATADCNTDPTGFGLQCHQSYLNGYKENVNGWAQSTLDYLLDRRPTSPGDWVKRNDYLVCGQNYRLADLYTWIGRLAPNAKINVIGYPSLFTDCNQPLLNVLDVAPQSIVDPRIDCQDMTWLAEVGVRVKRVIQTETQVATLSMIAQHLGNRINFIDTQLSDMSELNRDVSNAPSLFVTPANTTSFNPVVFKPLWDAYNGWSVFGQRPESFHPNQNGQNQLAAYIIPHLLS